MSLKIYSWTTSIDGRKSILSIILIVFLSRGLWTQPVTVMALGSFCLQQCSPVSLYSCRKHIPQDLAVAGCLQGRWNSEKQNGMDIWATWLRKHPCLWVLCYKSVCKCLNKWQAYVITWHLICTDLSVSLNLTAFCVQLVWCITWL